MSRPLRRLMSLLCAPLAMAGAAQAQFFSEDTEDRFVEAVLGYCVPSVTSGESLGAMAQRAAPPRDRITADPRTGALPGERTFTLTGEGGGGVSLYQSEDGTCRVTAEGPSPQSARARIRRHLLRQEGFTSAQGEHAPALKGVYLAGFSKVAGTGRISVSYTADATAGANNSSTLEAVVWRGVIVDTRPVSDDLQ